MAPGLRIINDTIIASGKQYEDFTPRELNVGAAMFILLWVLPTLGSVLILLARNGWWKQHQRLSIQTVMAAWLISIEVVGIVNYLQHGKTTRSMFIFATLHAQIEVVLDCVLLGLDAHKAFAYAWIQGLVLLLSALLLPSIQGVFAISTIIGGGNDAFFFLLFLYGKQYYFALGVLGHLLSGGAVFGGFVRNIGAVPFNALLFVGIWLNVGFTVAGIVRNEERYHEHQGAMANPLDGATFSKRTISLLGGTALSSSVIVTLILVYT